MIGQSQPSTLDYTGADNLAVYAITFPTYENANVIAEIVSSVGVVTALAETTDYTLANIGLQGSNGTLTFVYHGQSYLNADATLKSGYHLFIKFNPFAFQPAKFRDLGRFSPEVFEKTLDRLTMAILAVKDLAGKAIGLPTGSVPVTLPPLSGNASKILQVNPAATGFEYGVTSATILGYRNDAQAAANDSSDYAADSAISAAAALASQNAANTSKLAAASSATSANGSATAASASAAAASLSEIDSAFWANLDQYSKVQAITFADSPVTVNVIDDGTLYVVDDTSGDVVFNLPLISSTGLAWKVAMFKSKANSNKIIINRSGPSNTINGATSVNVTTPGVGANVHANSPTDWASRYFVSSTSAASGGGALPVGGLAGQVLTKNTATDGDASWLPSDSLINALIFG